MPQGNWTCPVLRAGVAPLGQEGAVRGELLDPVVAGVRHVDVPLGVGGHRRWVLELGVAGAEGSPVHDRALAVCPESLDAGGLEVGEVDVSIGGGDAGRGVELAVLLAGDSLLAGAGAVLALEESVLDPESPGEEEVPERIESLDPAVVRVGDVDGAGNRGDALRAVELPLSRTGDPQARCCTYAAEAEPVAISATAIAVSAKGNDVEAPESRRSRLPPSPPSTKHRQHISRGRLAKRSLGAMPPRRSKHEEASPCRSRRSIPNRGIAPAGDAIRASRATDGFEKACTRIQVAT